MRHYLGHGVVGSVDVHPQPREAAVKVGCQVVRVNVLAVESARGEQQRVLGVVVDMVVHAVDVVPTVHRSHALLVPAPAPPPLAARVPVITVTSSLLLLGLVPGLIVSMVVLLILVSGVGAVRGLEMVFLRLSRPDIDTLYSGKSCFKLGMFN